MGKANYVKPPKRIPGRPKVVCDEKTIFEMASWDYTLEEIAATVDVHVDTIYARYSEILKRGRDAGNGSIKHKLFMKAMDGDMSALIWLSKNRLGYRDKPIEEVTQVSFKVFVNELPKALETIG